MSKTTSQHLSDLFYFSTQLLGQFGNFQYRITQLTSLKEDITESAL